MIKKIITFFRMMWDEHRLTDEEFLLKWREEIFK